MKNKLLIISSLLGLQAYGQSPGPEVINTAGMTLANASYQLDYSVGEPAVGTISNVSNILTQGLLQPAYVIITEIGSFTEEQFLYFPVPVNNEMNIQTSLKISSIEIINVEGKKVMEKTWNDKAFDLSLLSPGLYIVHVFNPSNEMIKTFKITKQ